MAIRRKLSFDLLRYDSSGDADEEGEFVNGNGNAKLGIPTWNVPVATVKPHGRRRRNKGLNISAPDLVRFSAPDNGQIDGNNVADNSLYPPTSIPDTGCFTKDTVERSESGFSEQAEAGNGGISCHAEHTVLLLLGDGNNNNNNNTKDAPVTLDNQIEHTHTINSMIFRQATDMDANSNGIIGMDQMDSADPEHRVSVFLPDADSSIVVNTRSNLEDVSNMCSNWGSPELRQRTVSASLSVKANSCMKCIVENEIVEGEDLNRAATPSGGSQQQQQPDTDSKKQSVRFGDTQQAQLDWERVMAHSSEYPTYDGMSPFQYFLREIKGGNSLRSTTSVGNDKKRQRVYNTMFHVPWRCELLIDVGFFVCLDSFLSLLTIMPAKILAFTWRCLKVR